MRSRAFYVNARGGLGVNTNNPSVALDSYGAVQLGFWDILGPGGGPGGGEDPGCDSDDLGCTDCDPTDRFCGRSRECSV